MITLEKIELTVILIFKIRNTDLPFRHGRQKNEKREEKTNTQLQSVSSFTETQKEIQQVLVLKSLSFI